MFTSSVSIIFVTSLCFLSASSSSLCSHDGNSRARSARSLSNDSRAASRSLVTSRCINFACCIRVAEPTHRVVASWALDVRPRCKFFFFHSSCQIDILKLTIFPRNALLSPFAGGCLNWSHGFPPLGALENKKVNDSSQTLHFFVISFSFLL